MQVTIINKYKRTFWVKVTALTSERLIQKFGPFTISYSDTPVSLNENEYEWYIRHSNQLELCTHR
jgi:hypothetical protein